MDNGLEGKCVVVTGGGSGLGAALCHALAGAGAAVVAADVREDAADRIATSVRGAGGQCVATRLDVGDAAAGAALAVRRYVEPLASGLRPTFVDAG